MKQKIHPTKDLGVPGAESRIIVIGGGFAGLHFIKGLKKSNFQLVLLDRQNHHIFQPLLYQVATSTVSADSIAYPLRKMLPNHADFHFRMVNVERIDTHNNSIETNQGAISYDFAVIATGSKTNFFGLNSVAENALPMKSLREALEIRNIILGNLEKALLTKDHLEKEKLTSVVIAGGGPTGVELAGALAEFNRYIVPKDYPDLKDTLSIFLIEMQEDLLHNMSTYASQKSAAYLEDGLLVEVLTNTKIKSYEDNMVKTSNGNYPCGLLIWTGGISPAVPKGLAQTLLDSKDRIKTNAFGQVYGLQNVYALGDVAHLQSTKYKKGHPQLAAVAIQQGKFLAKHLMRLEKGKKTKPFRYKNRGVMSIIGKYKAVVDFANGWKLKGAMAWFLWLFVHIYSLIGFKNKISTLANWIWNYGKNDRETRVIISNNNHH